MRPWALPRSWCTTMLPKAGLAQAILLTVANGSAVVAALRAALRTSRLNRLVWIALAASMALSTLANGPYYLYPLITGHPVPFPGPVDMLWLLTYPCYVVALLAIGKQRARWAPRRPARRRHHDRRRRNTDVAVCHRSEHPGAG